MNTKDYLKSLEYPGRFIFAGQIKSAEEIFLVYGITGRSAASQARRIIKKESGLWVEPSTPELFVSGNPDLLIYPAMLYSAHGVVVSNGKHTEDIMREMANTQDPVQALIRGLRDWKYEPDSPIYTPRISLVFKGGFRIAASIIKRGELGGVIKEYFDLPLIPGKGWWFMTYSGLNLDPLPAFQGEPVSLEVEGIAAEQIAGWIYETLAPATGKQDLRVSVACVCASSDGAEVKEIKIINRQDG
ncbi:MAG: hypothetical protein H5U07_07335 [Candidatus Aminicenantes bacterium]|nr:hypothetical protein [Candidatus Aminicenantes bacterium]